MRKGVPERLRLLLLDADQKRSGNLPYRIIIDGLSKTGKTSAKGERAESIPPDANRHNWFRTATPPRPSRSASAI